MQRASYQSRYLTRGGLGVRREIASREYTPADTALADALDHRRGVLFSSSFEFPGRYTRWDMGFVDPPLVLSARGRGFTIEALNERGRILLGPVAGVLKRLPPVSSAFAGEDRIAGNIEEAGTRFSEESRSRQPSIFSVLRALGELFGSPEDEHLGLYGAFGYDLVFQFEPMPLHLPRVADQRDLVLYLPDEILIVDHMRQQSAVHRYDFEIGDKSTAGLPRATPPASYASEEGAAVYPGASDHAPGEYAALVERAREAFARGDLFEVVPGQLFSEPCPDSPSTVFHRLRRANPAPYGALINLGAGEFLVAASPEMFVRVEGRRIETCPISGTIARGRDALEDADRIRELLNSAKDESELTMCTDVDRNDKSRVCVAGSVRVIGRRQIEMYSRLIHTVDHVEGELRPEFDALDGFLSHAWAVTVTGAPKLWAIRFIEEHERSARRWYGGAIGRLTFDGNMNTGLTLRTIRMQDGVAEIRAGATLLYDSDPEAEEAETRLKAAAMLSAIRGGAPAANSTTKARLRVEPAPRVLLIDHEDSFVHTLAGYFRSTGAEVVTMRHDFARAQLAGGAAADLVVLSPGPGRPRDFGMSQTLDLLLAREVPVFGVCLGLQGIVEYFGGVLEVLPMPMHGKPSAIRAHPGRLLRGLPERITVGRYHSLYARRSDLPDVLSITAETEDGVIMAVEHKTLPIAAVQFHPESVMTSAAGVGMPIVEAAVTELCRPPGTVSTKVEPLLSAAWPGLPVGL
ncbi:MAG: anthranilate synthase component I [Alphaproteobacteria bacterium]|nr:anthranilate synthase component I [Alphaproteobacteria bacterium]